MSAAPVLALPSGRLQGREEFQQLVRQALAWAATALILLQATALQRYLGSRGLMAIERLTGMLLIMLSVDMLLDNLQSVFGHA